MKLRYFAWLRERLNRAGEDIALGPDVRTVSDVLDQLCASDEAAALVFADRSLIRAALDDDLVEHDAPVAGASILTLFPPMTGG